jgi:hypothetical protein
MSYKIFTPVLFILSVIIYFAFKADEEKGFSYNVSSYFIKENKIDTIPFHGDFISFKGYLFEFKTIYRSASGITLDLKTGAETLNENSWIDTVGIFVLDGTKRTFYEFSSFSDTCLFVRKGKISKKGSGIQFSDTLSTMQRDNCILEGDLRDTIINTQHVLYTGFSQKAKIEPKVSILNAGKMYFTKEKDFVTYFTFEIGSLTKENYPIVGVEGFVADKQGIFKMMLEDIKPLTPNQEKICNHLVKLVANNQ